jgi:hypothetical protein
MNGLQVADAGLSDFVVPAPLGLAVEVARDALDHAEDLCRYHGDVPPAKPGSWAGSCGSCEQPSRVRRALALMRRLAGELPPPRRYVIDADRPAHPITGLYPVVGVRALFAPADPEQARVVIERELETRGELGPFDLILTIKRGTS